MIWKGQNYGRNDALVQNGDDPFVEFWDLQRVSEPTQDFVSQPGAQFIQRYNASTLRETNDGRGLDLYVSEPAWKLDGAAMTMVRRFIKVELDAAARKAPSR
jgi:hypothetical protein